VILCYWFRQSITINNNFLCEFDCYWLPISIDTCINRWLISIDIDFYRLTSRLAFIITDAFTHSLKILVGIPMSTSLAKVYRQKQCFSLSWKWHFENTIWMRGKNIWLFDPWSPTSYAIIIFNLSLSKFQGSTSGTTPGICLSKACQICPLLSSSCHSNHKILFALGQCHITTFQSCPVGFSVF